MDLCAIKFSSRAWFRQCNASLLQVSEGIDEICKSIVLTKAKNVDHLISKELSDLALTISVLERSIYSYIHKIRSQKIDDKDAGPIAKPVQASELTPSNAKPVWKHSGAVLSLLDLLSDCLSELQSLLITLRKTGTTKSFLFYHRRELVRTLVFGFFGWSITHNLKLIDRFTRRVKAPSLSKVFMSSLIFIKLLFMGYTRFRVHRLKSLHSRLSSLVRFWQLCLAESVSPQIQSIIENQLLSPDDKSKRSSITIPISRVMLNIVGVGNIWYDYISKSDRDLSFLWYTFSVLYASVSFWYTVCRDSLRWYGYPLAYFAFVYYAMRHKIAASVTSDLLSSSFGLSSGSSWIKKFSKMRINQIKSAWRGYDDFIAEWKVRWRWIWLLLPRSESLLNFKWKPLRLLGYYFVCVLGAGPYGKSISSRIEPGIPQTVLQRIQIFKEKKIMKDFGCTTDVLFFIHGGGWVANFLNSDLTFLHDWSVSNGIPVVLFDCSRTPDRKVSLAGVLDQCMLAYRCILEGRGGFVPAKIILGGDSIGARLAVSLCLRLLVDSSNNENLPKLRMPDHVLLAYPPLNYGPMASPSRALFMMDPIAPIGVLNEDGDFSAGSRSQHTDQISNEILYPLAAPNTLITGFPSTSILVGSIDPFLDDSVDFSHLLSECGIDCKLKVFRNLPHGFLGFRTLIPRAQDGVTLASQWIKQALE